MIDFWVAVWLTVIVSLLTILADWMASRLIVGTRTIRVLTEILRSGLTKEDAYERIKDEIDKFKSSQSAALAWGADLATVAMSMDFVALGIWIHQPAFFPFFLRFSDDGVPREIPIWLILVGLHAILLVVSLVFKHNHAGTSAVDMTAGDVSFALKRWFSENGWMLASNSTGVIALLGAIVVFTNAL